MSSNRGIKNWYPKAILLMARLSTHMCHLHPSLKSIMMELHKNLSSLEFIPFSKALLLISSIFYLYYDSFDNIAGLKG
jgi:hypothetical protein